MMPMNFFFQSLRDDKLHIELCSLILVSVTMADCHGHWKFMEVLLYFFLTLHPPPHLPFPLQFDDDHVTLKMAVHDMCCPVFSFSRRSLVQQIVAYCMYLKMGQTTVEASQFHWSVSISSACVSTTGELFCLHLQCCVAGMLLLTHATVKPVDRCYPWDWLFQDCRIELLTRSIWVNSWRRGETGLIGGGGGWRWFSNDI